MMVEVTVPSVGESITEGIIAEWKVKDGDSVRMDDPLFELETDKITMAVTAKAAGRVSIKVQAGTNVKIGQSVAAIDTEAQIASASAATKSEGDGKAPALAAVPQTEGPRVSAPAGLEQMREKLSPNTDLDSLSPAVRRIVSEHGIDPSAISGTGKGGRITKEDATGFLAAKPPVAAPSEVATARRVLNEVQPLLEQLKGAVSEPAAATLQAVPVASTPTSPRVAASSRQTRKPMTTLRARIAERMIISQQTTATLTTFNEVDMTNLMAMRGKFQEAFQKKHGIKLGIMSFFVKAAIDALKAVPQAAAMIDGSDIVYSNFYDIGVAVSTDRGLVVPVLRNADALSFGQVELAIGDFGKRAHDRTLTLEELSGGVFTISNGGVFGSLLSTPILNPPQSAILGMHGIKKRPVVVGPDDRIEARPMMYLALSYDHRVIDGRESVAFLKRIVECVENPERMMLEI